MKARQIAPGLNSVYVIGPSEHVQLIERAADGLWGRWQSTPTTAKSVVVGGSMVATIGHDNRVSAFERGIWHPGMTWDREARELRSTHVPGRGAVLLAVDQYAVWSTWKEAPTTPWRAWQPLEGPVDGLEATADPGGGVAIFGIREGEVHHARQARALGAWEGWTSLDAPSGRTAMVRAQAISGGGLAIFAVGADGAVHHRWQDKPLDPWRPWESLGGAARSVSVAKSTAGGLAVFTVGTDDAVRYRYQSRPFGPWNPWTSLYGRVRDVTAQPSYTDGLEVFAIGLDGEVHHAWCERVDAPWTAWTALDYELSPFHAPVARAML
jgi:hypothetical protein